MLQVNSDAIPRRGQRSGPADREAGAEGSGVLDLHKGICADATRTSTIRDPRTGCKRWPEGLWLRSSLGELVAGRCRSTNLCAYCARLAAVENSELLSLDAANGVAPRWYVVLTTRSGNPDPAGFYESRRQLQRTLRSELEGYEAAWLLEMTTGLGPRSGGVRRPHFNAMVKGGGDGALVLRQVIDSVWCRREDAEPVGQYVGAIANARALTLYLALHFQKESQAMPRGWRGHRFTATRGYLWLPTPQAREVARDALRLKRELYRAINAGESGYDAELTAQLAVARAKATTWVLFHQALGVRWDSEAPQRSEDAPPPLTSDRLGPP